MYVDDVLAIRHDPKIIIKNTGVRFEINNNKYVPQKCYLGADVENFQLPGGKKGFSLTSNSYVKVSVDTVNYN